MERAVRDLRAEARRTNERRLLVLAGERERTRALTERALAAADVPLAETTQIAAEPLLECERLAHSRSDELLGRTRTAVVLDAHEECRPNAVGRAVGAVDGGGLLVVLAPPLAAWPDRRDGFDESLAVPPFGIDDVAGNFRRRLVETLRAHPGVAIVDADTETVRDDGLTDPAPRWPRDRSDPPDESSFPTAAYRACRTDDQMAAVRALERLGDADNAVVVEADRGRGKSSAAGLAAGSLAAAGDDVLVTAPDYRNAREVLVRAASLLSDLGALTGRDRADDPRRLDAGDGRVRFEPASAATVGGDGPDAVIVDEAAALPVRVLSGFLDAPAVAFTTTIHGYEGAGRGFSVRFRDRLADSDFTVTDCGMTEPIRYAAGDPIETWAFRALMLDARPAVDPLVADATPDAVEYHRLAPADLLADEHLLREVFGLLVLAHYRTEPNDLARLLDAPNVSVRALLNGEGHVVSVALLAREGDLPADLRAAMYEGERVRGNMIPDVLTTQLRDEDAAVPIGQRVLRIATHPAVRSRGLGSRLLSAIRTEFESDVDWLGVGYGATPELVEFWAENGYRTVHLSTTRNDASGEYSAIMLDPCSADGRDLARRHTGWFLDRIESVLSDPLDDLDPDVARSALRAVDGRPDPDLSQWERRLVAGMAGGAAIFDTNPAPVRRLALRHLCAPAGEHDLSDRQERLLVRKGLQGHAWGTVADELGFHSHAECMRTLGETVEKLVGLYCDGATQEELDRYR